MHEQKRGPVSPSSMKHTDPLFYLILLFFAVVLAGFLARLLSSVIIPIIFAVMLSLIITVINTARTAALQIAFECAVENSLCSVFGEYNKELLERYNLMYIDLSYLSNSPDIKNLEMHINDYYNDKVCYHERIFRLLFELPLINMYKFEVQDNVGKKAYCYGLVGQNNTWYAKEYHYASIKKTCDLITGGENMCVISFNGDVDRSKIKVRGTSESNWFRTDAWYNKSYNPQTQFFNLWYNMKELEQLKEIKVVPLNHLVIRELYKNEDSEYKYKSSKLVY